MFRAAGVVRVAARRGVVTVPKRNNGTAQLNKHYNDNPAGHDVQHHQMEITKFQKVTAGGGAIVGLFLASTLISMAMHDHHVHVEPEYAYMKIRNKPFPWGDGDTDLINCRPSAEEVAASKEHGH